MCSLRILDRRANVLAIEFIQFGAFFTAWLVFIRWLAGKLKNTSLGPALAYISH